ncbi:hypothetical protein L7F22_020814 [Adiantum nelumboides]|nr:hypothetical protein [Adiantum nelumboides]
MGKYSLGCWKCDCFVIYTGKETRAVMNTSHPETKFLILFSSIIPISLRVNLDMGKTVYARQIMNDDEIKGTIVRTSTLPEELGRIEYLLSDKTGTLTQNEMELKKLHMGTMSYGWIPWMNSSTNFVSTGAMLAGRGRRDMSSRVKDVVLALALCHNVTPVHEADGSVTYQASCPMKSPSFDGLNLDLPFHFREQKNGIVIRDRSSGELTFIQKGADTVMSKIVLQNDWLDEECANMAREGLRTLVVGRRELTEENWLMFEKEYKNARVRKNIEERNTESARVVTTFLESNLELLGLTGVEDKLQEECQNHFGIVKKCWYQDVSPTQKADVARLIRFQTKKRVCCIGDGGNDVSMIQAADVGLGIVGKEGKQASLAADFSLIQFSHLTKLLVWHGGILIKGVRIGSIRHS